MTSWLVGSLDLIFCHFLSVQVFISYITRLNLTGKEMRQFFSKVVREKLIANTMPFTRHIKYVNGKFKESDCN